MPPSNDFWTARRVLVTGGGGFLGRHVVERLRAAGADVVAPSRAESDLLDVAAEISVAELAALIASLCGYGGQLTFNPSLPDGQPRRSLDVTRAENAFGFRATMSLRDGLRRTIDWYEREVDGVSLVDVSRDDDAPRPRIVRRDRRAPQSVASNPPPSR